MNAHACCGSDPVRERREKSKSSGQRAYFRGFLKAIRWMAPGFVLLILPKCPVCLAAWIALGTGIGISFGTAAWIRWVLIALCVGSFLYLIAKRYLRNS